jgi:hypothetical protein
MAGLPPTIVSCAPLRIAFGSKLDMGIDECSLVARARRMRGRIKTSEPFSYSKRCRGCTGARSLAFPKNG